MKILRSLIAMLCVLAGTCLAEAAPFRNLNFEDGVLQHLFGDLYGGPVDEVVPGWTVDVYFPYTVDFAYLNLNDAPYVSVALHDDGSGWGPLPLEGDYSLGLTAGEIRGRPHDLYSVSISQDGDIPPDSKSVRFSTLVGYEPREARYYTRIWTDGVRARYAGEISANATYAYLSFTTPEFSLFMFIDDIEFSPLPVPEPATWGLLLLGGAAIPLLRRRQREHDGFPPRASG